MIAFKPLTRLRAVCVPAVLAFVAAATLMAQSVFPTGTTIFDPDRTWSGFTVLSPLAMQAVPVIDMNGTIVKRWEGFNNSAGGPARVMPGGYVIAASGARPPNQESLELVERDFDGTVLWSFSHNEEITAADGKKIWAARQHHDWQREDFPAGYYSPESAPNPQNNDRTLLLTHATHVKPAVADVTIEDDRLIEVSRTGEVLWAWMASDHIDEFKLSPEARAVIKAGPASNGPAGAAGRRTFDWLHVNSAHYVGPNRWFDAGDTRFAPTNVIISSREASLLAIVARDGHIVWQIGPDYSASEELRAIRQVIGQHHAHLIPKGLPGAGNVLVFDNGGSSGYGFFSPIAPDGRGGLARSTSRVLEINPVTLELVWSYTNPRFFATNISGAQRLPNGNTLITSGPTGRIFEVTKEGAIVWEYIWPYFGANNQNSVYRAYRIPYAWISQLPAPKERKVTPPAPGDFHVQ
jgi:arylsulfotransferase ASST